MDFSYIKSASSCPASCAESSRSGSGGGGVGPVEGDSGLPLLPGNPGAPQTPGTPTVDGNPNVDGGGDDPTPGQEINCVNVELVPASAVIDIGELFPFAIKVTYSNGTVGYPALNAVFSSSNDEIATFDNPTQSQFRTSRDADDPLLDEGILNDPLNIDHGFYVRGVSLGKVTITATYDAPSTQDPLVTNSNANWYGACSATLTGTVTVTGDVFMSSYVWGIPADQDPDSVLTSDQIACHDTLFEIEKTLLATSLGVAVEWGENYWLNQGISGNHFSMDVKSNAGVCDPNDPTGNQTILFANFYTRAARYTIQ